MPQDRSLSSPKVVSPSTARAVDVLSAAKGRRNHHKRSLPGKVRKSASGRVWPLTTWTAQFSHEKVGAPTATVGRCPLPAVLSMPSSRRSVTAMRPEPPLAVPFRGGRNTRFNGADGPAPDGPITTQRGHMKPARERPLCPDHQSTASAGRFMPEGHRPQRPVRLAAAGRCRYARSKMPFRAHAPVQDAHDLDVAAHLAVEDRMRPLGVPAIAGSDVIAGSPEAGHFGQGVKSPVALGQLGVALLPPAVALGAPADGVEILPCRPRYL